MDSLPSRWTLPIGEPRTSPHDRRGRRRRGSRSLNSVYLPDPADWCPGIAPSRNALTRTSYFWLSSLGVVSAMPATTLSPRPFLKFCPCGGLTPLGFSESVADIFVSAISPSKRIPHKLSHPVERPSVTTSISAAASAAKARLGTVKGPLGERRLSRDRGWHGQSGRR